MNSLRLQNNYNNNNNTRSMMTLSNKLNDDIHDDALISKIKNKPQQLSNESYYPAGNEMSESCSSNNTSSTGGRKVIMDTIIDGKKFLQSTSSANNASRIRSRLLTSLGFSKKIRPQPEQEARILRKRNSRNRNPSSYVVDKDSCNKETEISKDNKSLLPILRNRQEKSQNEYCFSVTTFQNKKKSGGKVSFDKVVSVKLIPSWKAYPESVRDTLWSNPMESQMSILRNMREFEYEKWNWHTALEEQDMILLKNGTRIHPVTFLRSQQCCNLQNHFFQVLSATNTHAMKRSYNF